MARVVLGVAGRPSGGAPGGGGWGVADVNEERLLGNLDNWMGPDQEPPAGHGDDMDEELPRSSWLPPDDRLWRHPSEVRSNPAPPPSSPGPPAAVGWVSGFWGRALALSLVSGLLGAAACAGVLYATGSLGTTISVKSEAGPQPVFSRGASTTSLSLPDTVGPWVVGLSVNGDQGVELGSGVVIDTVGNDCYVVTDSELFAEAGPGDQVSVTTYTGSTKNGQLAQVDASAGIAIVKVGWAPASTAVLGTVAEVQTGQEVFAVGSEWVSASEDGSYFATGPIADQATYVQPANGGSGALFPMLVADMSVDSSAYGGALVDSSGDLIGITNPASAQLQKPQLTYVTPIDTVMADVSQLIRYGHLAPHAWLGVEQASDLSGPGADAMGVTGAVEVDEVSAGSPLAKAGLQDGDMITAVGGNSISSVGALLAWMALAKPGQVTQVNWLHDGHRRAANVTLADQPSAIGGGS